MLPVRDLAEQLAALAGSPAPEDPPLPAVMHEESAMADWRSTPSTSTSGWAGPRVWGARTAAAASSRSTRVTCCATAAASGTPGRPTRLVAAQAESLETALWVALRTLEDERSLTLGLSQRAAERGHRLSSRQFEQQTQEALSSAGLLRDLITQIRGPDAGPRLTGPAESTDERTPRVPPEADPEFETLLAYLKDERGFDFTGYKRASLMRRVQRRMEAVGIDDFEAYQDHLAGPSRRSSPRCSTRS